MSTLDWDDGPATIAAGVRWVDLVIDAPDKTFYVTWFVCFQNARDAGSLPLPRGSYPGAPVHHVVPPAATHLSDHDFDRHVSNFKTGVSKYWSRSISSGWSVKTTVSERPTGSIKVIMGRAVKDGSVEAARRSFNLGTYREGLPVVLLLSPDESDTTQQYISAHELGHSVLREQCGWRCSFEHKGTAQNPAAAPPGETDLMHYYQDSGEATQARAKASHEDVMTLLRLARVVVL